MFFEKYWKNWKNFNGRSQRKELIVGFLSMIPIAFILNVVRNILCGIFYKIVLLNLNLGLYTHSLVSDIVWVIFTRKTIRMLDSLIFKMNCGLFKFNHC